MRKITLLIASFLFSFGMYAQQTLSHSTSQTSDGGGVACVSNPDEVDASGDETISDNVFYRAYTPANFGFTGNFDAMGISFIAAFVDIGGSNPTVTNSVKLFTSNQTFPNGTLTEVASKDFDVSAADDGTQFDVMFDNPVTFDASTELIVAVDIQAGPPVPNNYDLRIGVNDAGEDDPGYISSAGCAIDDPTTLTTIGFPDTHIILNLLGDTTLSTDDFGSSEISIFPNPASEFINLDIPSNISVEKVNLYDALGKNIDVALNDNTINISNIASGMYILDIETDKGSLSKRVIIE